MWRGAAGDVARQGRVVADGRASRVAVTILDVKSGGRGSKLMAEEAEARKRAHVGEADREVGSAVGNEERGHILPNLRTAAVA